MDQPKIERMLQIMQLLSADIPYTIGEFPVTSGEVFQVKRRWCWEGDVNRFEGIGRFVLGLHREVVVEEGEAFLEWLKGGQEYWGGVSQGWF